MKITYPIILIFITTMFTMGSIGYVILYPGTVFYGDKCVFTFSNTDGINVSYIEVGDNYIMLGNINLSVSSNSVIDINISYVNSNGTVAKNNQVLGFNATYTSGSVSFSFTGNNTLAIYNLFIDNSLINTYEASSFSWSYNSWSTHSFSINLEGYRPDPPYNGNSVYDPNSNSVNLSWSRGNGSDREIVVMKQNSYPVTPSDGTIYQNSTKLFYNFTINQSGYFTIWSFNSSTGYYSSTGLNIPWGALTINVFNASKTWEKVDPFGLIIQNSDGSQIYRDTTVSPPINLDLNSIPIGSNTVFIINSSGYKTQTFYRDTLVNTFMNYTFLLPPVETTTPGEGDTDPNTGEPTNQTASQLYLITLLNEVDQPIMDGLIEFSLYNNATDTYDMVGSFLTDGAGQGTIWLVPNKLYMVTCSVPGSDRYQSNVSYWTPSNLVLTKTFKLRYAEEEIQPPQLPQEYVMFNGTRTNTTLTLYYNDLLMMTLNTTVYVYEINVTTGDETLFYMNHTENVDSFKLVITGLDANNSYRVALKYNHSVFGSQDPTLFFPGYRKQITIPSSFNTLMTNIFGPNPLVWSHVIMFLILVALMFFADSEDAGKILILIGGIFIFINSFIGFDNALTLAAGGIIPGLLILMGIIVEWNNRKVMS